MIPDRSGLPPGFEELRHGSVRVWVRPGALSWVEEALARSGSLHSAARREAAGETDLHGRAPVFVVPPTDPRWAVRHNVRGGTIAPVLGDRYLRLGLPRPFRETLASERLRSIGIPTPEVIAAAVYPAGPIYRADLMTGYVPDASDLSRILFGDAGGTDPALEVRALELAGVILRQLGTEGAWHPDVNVKNLLVQKAGGSIRVHLIDLDGFQWSRRTPPDRLAGRMHRRLLRSIAKWEARTGRKLIPAAREALESGVSVTC